MQESPERNCVGPESDRRLRRLQTALFTVYFVLAAASLTVMVVSACMSPFRLTLTTTASYLVAGTAVALSLLLSLLSLRATRRVMTACACWAGVAIAVVLWVTPLSWQSTLLIGLVWAGMLALVVVSVIRTLGVTEPSLHLSTSVPSIAGAVVLTLLLFLALLGSGFGAVEVESGPSSPGGTWSLYYKDIDGGALGGDSYVIVGRDLWGLVRQERTLFMGEWQERPPLEWLDETALLIDDVSYDLSTTPTRDRR